MANASTTALLSQADMQSILSAVKNYVDKQVELANGDTTAVANLLNAIIGADDKAAAIENQKTIRAISAEEVAKIVAGADASYDTLKEIADWIMSDTTGAAKMASDILTLQGYVGVPAEGEDKPATGLFKTIADNQAAALKAVSDEETRAKGVEEGLDGRIEDIEALFEGENSVDAKIAAAQKAAEDHSDANLETAQGAIEALKDTEVSSTSTSNGATVTLGGTVGAPTVTVSLEMVTEAQLKELTDMFAISSESEEENAGE